MLDRSCHISATLIYLHDYHLIKHLQWCWIVLVVLLWTFGPHNSHLSLSWVYDMIPITRLWDLICWRLLPWNIQSLSSVASFSMLGLVVLCCLPLRLIYFGTFFLAFLPLVESEGSNEFSSKWFLSGRYARLLLLEYIFACQDSKSCNHQESVDAHLLSKFSTPPNFQYLLSYFFHCDIGY